MATQILPNDSVIQQGIKPKHPRFLNLDGQVFGRLTILAYHGKRYWYCRCSCGNLALCCGYDVQSGKVASCGCYRIEHPFKHGKSRTALYKLWQGMIARCENPQKKQFHRYGGRGIKVCERWHDFDLFSLDVGDRPSTQHSLERKDNDGDYTPLNCKWADKKEQSNNRTDTVWLTLKGITKSRMDWCREFNLSPTTVANRKKKGMTDEQALTHKKGKHFRKWTAIEPTGERRAGGAVLRIKQI